MSNDKPDKTNLIYETAKEEFRMFMEQGVRFRDGKLVERDASGQWAACSKQQILNEMIFENAIWLKPSEIEREVFPLVVATFQVLPEAQAHD